MAGIFEEPGSQAEGSRTTIDAYLRDHVGPMIPHLEGGDGTAGGLRGHQPGKELRGAAARNHEYHTWSGGPQVKHVLHGAARENYDVFCAGARGEQQRLQ